MRLEAQLQFYLFIFFFRLHKYRCLFCIPWRLSPRATLCLVLFTLIVWGALIKSCPCSHLSSNVTTLPRHYHKTPRPTRGCLMSCAFPRIYNVQAAAAAAGNLQMCDPQFNWVFDSAHRVLPCCGEGRSQKMNSEAFETCLSSAHG